MQMRFRLAPLSHGRRRSFEMSCSPTCGRVMVDVLLLRRTRTAFLGAISKFACEHLPIR